MTPEQIEEAASRLFEAERTGTQCGLLSLAYPDMTLDDAYAVQSALVAKKRAAGTGVIGWKIGLTSRAMQQALNITTPDSGVLLDDMLFANSAAIPAGRFIQPRVEAEIAFIMKSDLAGADVTRDNVLAATAHVAPRSKSSTPASCAPIPKPARRGPSPTPSPTMPPMPASFWARSVTPSTRLTCAGSALSSSATALSRRPVLAPESSMTL
jgi:hypothetical protein